ncbi:MAG: hypothetical protein CV087_08455 [Candidatus Brocadia sp. WS118]|nr:MAG: hypothetical protein CV087_08455 [Candidatus Brocadia sp. WS118]
MKYRINGEIVAAEDLAKHPDAKLWIRAIQTAQGLAFTEAGLKAVEIGDDLTALSKIRIGSSIKICFERQLALIGIEIVE